MSYFTGFVVSGCGWDISGLRYVKNLVKWAMLNLESHHPFTLGKCINAQISSLLCLLVIVRFPLCAVNVAVQLYRFPSMYSKHYHTVQRLQNCRFVL